MKTSKKLSTFFMTGLMIYLLSGCVVRTRPVVVRPAPPAARVEVIPAPPSPRHTWVPGYHRWHRGHYEWRPGYYRRGRRY
ncbi:hypothetical protein [Runella sp.]|uniref:hypothetical protein n=1 Tax=Runella sp. TaxID=1960881 RepID=UPI003D13F540